MSDVPDRLKAALQGRYSIERQLGEGGMATVYLAQDVRHDRRVALKVLRPELAAVVGAERFLAEIRTTANLQHPHILPLFDSGEAGGFLFYVMPYVKGESLRDRLDREKQLPVPDAVRIAVGVAAALEHAHREGVIHRDIKPANILLQDGEPVVADFGIALAVSAAGGGRLTETGLSLGTPHYMSPEQAAGDRNVDARSDIYALACMLYEMLSGEPPYAGPTAQAVLGKILTETPRPLAKLRRSVPRNVDAAVEKALEKLPADRFASASEFARALGDAGFEHNATGAVPGAIRRRSAQLPWLGVRSASAPLFALGAVAVIASSAAVMGWLRKPEASISRTVRARIDLPSGFGWFIGTRIEISPDGSAIAYSGQQGNVPGVFLRPLSEMEVRLVPGTEGGGGPAFSPDGQSLVFERGSSILKVGLDGQGLVELGRAPNIGSLSWTVDGTIVFGSTDGALYQIAEAGGEPTLLARSDDPSVLFRDPELLPDGEAAIFSAQNASGGEFEIRILDLRSGEMRTLASGGDPHYVPTGHILYRVDQSIYGIPFDLRRKEATGPPVPVLSEIPASSFRVSNDGTAIHTSGEGGFGLTLVSRDGRREPFPIDAGGIYGPRFSPDGRRVFFRSGSQLMIYDLAVGSLTRLESSGVNYSGIWSRDGASVSFNSERPGSLGRDAFRQPANGNGPTEQLFALEHNQAPLAWLADGRLLVSENHPERLQDLVIMDLSGDSLVRSDYLRADWNEWYGSISPDGRWLAYASDESGDYEVYVRSFPEPGDAVQVSEAGGLAPRWGSDGETIYYLEGTDLKAARVRTQPTFAVAGRETVLSEPGLRTGPNAGYTYDVHPDGDRFVLVTLGDETDVQLTVVTNWFEELRARMSAAEN